jgi:hypothetical protein
LSHALSPGEGEYALIGLSTPHLSVIREDGHDRRDPGSRPPARKLPACDELKLEWNERRGLELGERSAPLSEVEQLSGEVAACAMPTACWTHRVFMHGDHGSELLLGGVGERVRPCPRGDRVAPVLDVLQVATGEESLAFRRHVVCGRARVTTPHRHLPLP